jgi:hypothetical protein
MTEFLVRAFFIGGQNLKTWPRGRRRLRVMMGGGRIHGIRVGRWRCRGGEELAVGNVHVMQDVVGEAIDAEEFGERAGVGGELGVKFLIGEDALELIGQIAAVPRFESEAALLAVDVDDFGDAAMIGDDDRRAVAHGFGGNHAEGFAVDRGVDDTAALLIKRAAHAIADAAFPEDDEAQMLGDGLAGVGVFQTEAGTADAQELQLNAARPENFDGIQQQVDSFFGILPPEIGDDRHVGLKAGEDLLKHRKVGGGIDGRFLGQFNAGIDGGHAVEVDAHFLVEALGVVTADCDGGPAGGGNGFAQAAVEIIEPSDAGGEVGENFLALESDEIIEGMPALLFDRLGEGADHGEGGEQMGDAVADHEGFKAARECGIAVADGAAAVLHQAADVAGAGLDKSAAAAGGDDAEDPTEEVHEREGPFEVIAETAAESGLGD